MGKVKEAATSAKILGREQMIRFKAHLRSFLGLTSVLHPSSNALHGQDEGVLQPRRILAGRVQLHELCSRLVPVHDFLGQVGPQCDMVIWVTDALHRVGLADIQCGDVRVTEAETLLQV